MIKLITIDELRPGMFIHKLEVWWIKDERIHNQMLITDPRQIATLRSEGIRQLWIDLDRSVQAPIATSIAKRTIGRTPFFQELDQAQLIFQQGKPKVLAMFNEARLGNGLKLDYMMDLVDDIAGSITREPSAMLSVARLKNHDDYTYLHSMAAAGWVERRPDPHDRRAIQLYLMPKAEPILDEMAVASATTRDAALIDFSSDERDTLFELLNRLKTNLRRSVCESGAADANHEKTRDERQSEDNRTHQG